MRMYNPEWEAIKRFKHTPSFVDLQYDLLGLEIPADHGHALFEEICRHLPWLRDVSSAGIHPVHGAPSGRNDNLVINRRVKLVLRLPIEHATAAQVLVGKDIDPGAGQLRIGPLKEKAVTPYSTLYSHFVAVESDDEAGFLVEIRRQMQEIEIQAGLIPGKFHKMHIPNRVIGGYSLMLHDIDLMQSLALQEQGLGLHRGYGCGIFIPHKSIKEVAID
jgi:CRISPR-associated protein Cas6